MSGGEEGIAAGMEVIAFWAEEHSSGASFAVGAGSGGTPKGVLFVGPMLTKFVMRSGVLAWVTLSMNCHAGRRRTMVEWSEWSGTGMSEAESMSFWSSVRTFVRGSCHLNLG